MSLARVWWAEFIRQMCSMSSANLIDTSVNPDGCLAVDIVRQP